MNLDALEETAANLVRQRGLPGLVVGVATSGGPVFAEGFGFADVASRRRQDAAVRHRIGSVTKLMTALCVMALVEEGRLSLESHVGALLPDLSLHGYGNELTVRHLLAHVGGIGEAPTVAVLPRAAEIIMSSERRTVSIAELYPEGIEVEVRPGSKWAYANHGYGLLGAIIATTERQPLNDAMRTRIFDALGMKNSDVLDHRDPALSQGYVRDPEDNDSIIPVAEFLHLRAESLRAAGGGQSTLEDMNLFASSMLRDADGIVSPETFALMTKPHWCLDERLTGQGLGFVRSRRFGRPAIVHAGGIQGGWVTMLTLLPQDDLALVTFMNLTSADFGPVDSALLQAVLDAPGPRLPQIDIDESMLVAAPGTYQCTPGALTNARVIRDQGRVFVERVGNELYLRAQRGDWSEGLRMAPADDTDPTLFTLVSDSLEPSHVALVREADGTVSALRTGVTELVRAPPLY